MKYGVIAVLVALCTLGIGQSELFTRSWFIQGISTPVYACSFIAAFLVHLCFWLGIFLMSVSSRIVAYVLFPIIVIVQILVYYATSRYGAVCEELAVAVYNASWGQVINYLNFKSFVWAAISLSLPFCCMYGLRRFSFPERIKQCRRFFLAGTGLCLLSFVLPVLVFISVPSVTIQAVRCYVERDPWRLTFPIKRSEEEACLAILQEKNEQQARLYESAYIPIWNTCVFFHSLYKFHFPAELVRSDSISSWVNQKAVPNIVVFYIGESFRADHNPMNGYCRNTLPNISLMPNIINLPYLHCSETQTISSIYSFLVLKDESTGNPKYTSFLDILIKHGYKAFLMVGMNSGTWYNTPVIAPLFNGRMSIFSRPSHYTDYPEGIKILRDAHHNPLFVMIEDGAGHMPYSSSTYPFGTATVIDRFDNAMVDIDMTVTAVIESIKEEEAILFFTSDHGESFGESGRWGHGGPKTAKEQLHVTGFIWYSDSYAEKYPDVVRHLKENAEKFTSLDYAYHTIISMCGIASNLQIPSQDMTRPQE